MQTRPPLLGSIGAASDHVLSPSELTRAMVLLLLLSVIAFAVLLAILIRRARRRRAASDDVIYLGYDDQDNVSSMRSAMLEKLRRGELDPVE